MLQEREKETSYLITPTVKKKTKRKRKKGTFFLPLNEAKEVSKSVWR